jgi:hypothetical protein
MSNDDTNKSNLESIADMGGVDREANYVIPGTYLDMMLAMARRPDCSPDDKKFYIEVVEWCLEEVSLHGTSRANATLKEVS